MTKAKFYCEGSWGWSCQAPASCRKQHYLHVGLLVLGTGIHTGWWKLLPWWQLVPALALLLCCSSAFTATCCCPGFGTRASATQGACVRCPQACPSSTSTKRVGDVRCGVGPVGLSLQGEQGPEVYPLGCPLCTMQGAMGPSLPGCDAPYWVSEPPTGAPALKPWLHPHSQPSPELGAEAVEGAEKQMQGPDPCPAPCCEAGGLGKQHSSWQPARRPAPVHAAV